MFSVLFYDRDPAAQDLARRSYDALPDGARIFVAATYGEAVRYIREEPVDAVVTDPLDDDVLPLLSLVHDACGAIPFVLVMAPGREKVALTAFNSGATQYIEKGVGDSAIVTALRMATIPALAHAEMISLQKRAEHLEFLSRTALDFVGMADEDDIYTYIGERVRELVPEALVRVSSFDTSTRLLTVRAVVAPPEIRRAFEEELGRTLVGRQLPIDALPSAEPALRSQTILEGPPTTYLQLYRTVPEEVCDRIDARLGPGRTFILGIRCERGIYGTVVIRLVSAEEFANRDVVEAFVGQASVALQRRRTRQRLRESEARYRAVVESQRELICRFAPDGTHLFANEAYCRFFNLDPAAVTGTRFLPDTPAEERATLRDYFKGFAPKRPDGLIEHRVILPGGAARWLQWSDRAFFDRNGGVEEFQSVGRDVTERKEAEQALAALTAELEARVDAATAGLRVANRDLEAFSHHVSHDLRSPLRAIDGYLGILMARFGSDLDPDAVVLVGKAREGVSRAGRFLEGLLSLAELSHQPLNLEPVETGSLVRSVLGELLPDPTQRRVEVAIGTLPPCRADAEMLRHVYQNLLSNALKFTRTRDPARLGIHGGARDGENVFAVSDNGIGFPPEYAARIFEDFARLHDRREYEGSGIGLPLVRRIVERHGGKVWAESTPGEGSTFFFTLPAA